MSRSHSLRALPGVTLLVAGCALLTGNGGSGSPETEQVAQAAWSVGEYDEAARLFERAAEQRFAAKWEKSFFIKVMQRPRWANSTRR
ncbi:outer membrane protein assembly factor BamD [Pseudogemmobacter bohemicus]|uniref:hypothetical protein n=1 Tax=Pseudogemmobacter bohemicus TaxID=2250708 RepID=UPI0013006B07|nr:hypothetical protein [Pseudogemmobacter bohemicus]